MIESHLNDIKFDYETKLVHSNKEKKSYCFKCCNLELRIVGLNKRKMSRPQPFELFQKGYACSMVKPKMRPIE